MNYHSDKFVLYTLSGCTLAFRVGEVRFGGDSNCSRNLNLILSSCLTYLMADMCVKHILPILCCAET
jgi:hypothetical protein